MDILTEEKINGNGHAESFEQRCERLFRETNTPEFHSTLERDPLSVIIALKENDTAELAPAWTALLSRHMARLQKENRKLYRTCLAALAQKLELSTEETESLLFGEEEGEEQKRPRLQHTYLASELQNKVFPEPKYAVPKLLPEGLSFLCGRPKSGKSWAALDFALSVASGGKALGKVQVEQGDCLYLALEDNQRRLQGRIKALLADDESFPERLTLSHTSPKLDSGLVEAVATWLNDHPQARLVVIDTLARIRGKRGRNADSYAEDSDLAEALQKLATDHSVALLILHHTRKAEADDPLEMVSGTFGLTGGADAVLVLQRCRGQADSVLSVTGRDIEERDLALKFDAGAWTILGDAEEYTRSKERQSVLDLLRQVGEPMTPKAISELLGKNYNTTKWLLIEMLRSGQITATGQGTYTLDPTPPTPPTDPTDPTPPTHEQPIPDSKDKEEEGFPVNSRVYTVLAEDGHQGQDEAETVGRVGELGRVGSVGSVGPHDTNPDCPACGKRMKVRTALPGQPLWCAACQRTLTEIMDCQGADDLP